MKEKFKDIAIRAMKTFWQAALATLLVAIPEIAELIPNGADVFVPVLVSAGVGALAAGLSAVWNGVFAPIIDKYKVVHTHEGEHVCDGSDCDCNAG